MKKQTPLLGYIPFPSSTDPTDQMHITNLCRILQGLLASGNFTETDSENSAFAYSVSAVNEAIHLYGHLTSEWERNKSA